ncbi:transmembrane protein [Cystoisospora suis]|uniref:Transmembrane protein n=1 Tax=Cystoisospora suis TaxID=483139 RepID=A0A2C6LGL7_9APIC|nr:transmembrane protein [Cystoisospora suis]
MFSILYRLLGHHKRTGYSSVVCASLLYLVLCVHSGNAWSEGSQEKGALLERGDRTPVGADSFVGHDRVHASSTTPVSGEDVDKSKALLGLRRDGGATSFSLGAERRRAADGLFVSPQQGRKRDGKAFSESSGRSLRRRVDVLDGVTSRTVVSGQREDVATAGSPEQAGDTHIGEAKRKDVARVASPVASFPTDLPSPEAKQERRRVHIVNKAAEITGAKRERERKRGQRQDVETVLSSHERPDIKSRSYLSILKVLRPRRKGGKRALLFFLLTLFSFASRLVMKDNVFNVLHFLFRDQPLAHLLFAGTEPFYFLLFGGFTIYYLWVFYRGIHREQVYNGRVRRVARKEALLRRRLRNPNLSTEEKNTLELRRLLLREEVADVLIEGQEPPLPGVKNALSAGIAFFVLLARRVLGSRVKLCDFGVRYVGSLMLLGLVRAAFGLWARHRVKKIRKAREETRQAIEREITRGTFGAALRARVEGASYVQMNRKDAVPPAAAGKTAFEPSAEQGEAVGGDTNKEAAAITSQDFAPEQARVELPVAPGGW